MQRIGPFVRENGLANMGLRNHDDLVEHGCHHGKCLTDQPWRIMSTD